MLDAHEAGICRFRRSAMSTLRIKRDSGYADYLRAYSVLVDGARVGEIKNGETRDFPILPGQHQLRLKIDWCGSNTIHFVASNSDVLEFSAKPNLRGLKLLAAFWYLLAVPSSWIILNRD